jgi:hypothetical protein
MKSDNITLETAIPFSGFYYSLYDCEFDHSIERDCEYFADQWGVDQFEIQDLALKHLDLSDARDAVARTHLEFWGGTFNSETGLAIDLEFSAFTSPRFYNFETDRLFAKIALSDVQKCFDACQRDGFTELRKLIIERFTSRDGFISHYSSRLETWLATPLAEWDCNQVETLLIAVLSIHRDAQEIASEVEMSTIEHASGNGLFDCVDWDAVQAELKGEAA